MALSELYAKVADLALAKGAHNLGPGEPWRYSVGDFDLTLNRDDQQLVDRGMGIPPFSIAIWYAGGMPCGVVTMTGGTMVGTSEDDAIMAIEQALSRQAVSR